MLLGNNYFYLRGGAERVFFDEAAILKRNGHQVSYFSTYDERNCQTSFSDYFVSKLEYRLANTIRFIYCRESKKQIERLLKTHKPDIAHLHNIYQDISPSILHVLRRFGLPVVMTLHDLKMVCPNYTMMHDGVVCEDCRGNSFYHCMVNRCKQGSYLYSILPAIEAYVHSLLNIWRKNVHCFISPSHFLKDKLTDFGWDPARIAWIPNFIDCSKMQASCGAGAYLLYFGRLSPEKGVRTLLEAYSRLSPMIKLMITGDGPARKGLENLAEQCRGDVVFTGHLSGERLENIIAQSRAVIMPSEWYENAPLSLLEAFAYGKPVVGARIGGIPEMIDDGINGILFESGNVDSLQDKIEMVSTMPESKIVQMGKAAREKVEKEYNAEVHYKRLMEVYERAVSDS